MNIRYQEIKAVSFNIKGEHVLVPFWECGFEKNPMYGEQFIYKNERSSAVFDVTWDCKKKHIINVHHVLLDKEIKHQFSIGETVVCTKNEYSGKVALTTIKNIVEDTDTQIYYEKVKDLPEVRRKIYNPPEHCKLVAIQYKEYKYVLDGFDEPVHSIYVKKVETCK